MNIENTNKYIEIYRDGLLNDVLPFWIEHSVDYENGGFIFCLDQDGSIIDTDKSVWIQCRFVWLLSTLYNTVEKKQQWLDLAKHGVDFILKHCFDDDGRMFFIVTKDGKPLRKRRYISSEFFATLALSAYAKASGDESIARKAEEVFGLIEKCLTTPGMLAPKLVPETRQMKGLGDLMMLICVGQELKAISDDPKYDRWINKSIETVKNEYVNDEYQCVLENVGPGGEFIDHFDGRLITPGHGIETAWFILNEARNRGGDQQLINLGTKMVDYCWQQGWDKEYGGMIYFRDAKGLPSTEYWHDMKFWWQQNETIIATLLSYHLTGNEKYLKWHGMAHDWAYKYFPDTDNGEWFGYLHRDGRISNTIKGNMWKGPFHLPRMQWYCWQLLEQMKK